MNRSEQRPLRSGLYLIGLYKLGEGLLLIAAGIGALRLLHQDIQPVVMHWVHVLRVDPDNHYIHQVMLKLFAISPRQLREIGFGTFFYAALRLAEGVGLVLRRRWGEYLTVIATALFIPLEIWEIARHYTHVKLFVFIANSATVWYLIWALRRGASVRAPDTPAENA